MFRFRNFKPEFFSVEWKAPLDSSCVLVIMKCFEVTFLQKRRNCSKIEQFDLLKPCNLKEERKDGKKRREILYRGIMTDTNARFNQKTSFNFAFTNINVYFSFVKSYYFKCYHKNQMVINLCTRGSFKGSYKRIKIISTNSKTS